MQRVTHNDDFCSCRWALLCASDALRQQWCHSLTMKSEREALLFMFPPFFLLRALGHES